MFIPRDLGVLRFSFALSPNMWRDRQSKYLTKYNVNTCKASAQPVPGAAALAKPSQCI